MSTRAKSKTRAKSRSRSKPRSRSKSRTKTKTTRSGGTTVRKIKRAGSSGFDPTSRLKDYVTRVYSKYSTPVDYKVLDDLEKAFNIRVRTTSYKVHDYPMLQITINNGHVSHKTAMGNDQRVLEACKIVKLAIEYATRHKLPVPNTTLYLWVSDSYPYDIPDIYKKFPIMTYCTPRNMDYIIFPDATLTCLQMAKKYTGDCSDFDTVKDIIIKHHVSEKIPIIYFKGTNTTVRQGRLREDLEILSKKSADISVTLDAWNKYEPLYTWSKYKWLLNLPGRFPWSNRLIWLFLMKSGVININLTTTSDMYQDEPYNIFINLIVEPGTDYINIESQYVNKITSNSNQTPAALAEQLVENTRIYDKILSATKSITNTQYDQMIESAYKKVNSLSNQVIYRYMYDLIVANSLVVPG